MSVSLNLFVSLTGSVGFCILFGVSPRHLPHSTVGAFLTGILYLFFHNRFAGEFLPCFLCSAFAATYAEGMARLRHAPADVFLIPAIINLLPGSTLCNTMRSLVAGDHEKLIYYGTDTAQTGFGIAAGIVAVTACMCLIEPFYRMIQNQFK